MTQNQIAYQTLLETQRSHRVDEAERNRANLRKESLTDREVATAEKRVTSQNLRDLASAGKNFVESVQVLKNTMTGSGKEGAKIIGGLL